MARAARRFGHWLAAQASGRGRGSRSLLHTFSQGSLMHDASYWGCIQLAGSRGALEALLSSCG